ncbi:MAG TPA: PaaI family thioesterase [Acetobacteraceae bacterium]|nr:PaaI family thioesterase [Acetobacteraceae bacterium]
MDSVGVPAGWVIRPGKAFNTHVGPFYQRAGGDALQCGFIADERHGNKRGVVHGGMLATAFDVALGNASWDAAGGKPCATIQLNVQFVGAMSLGEFAEIAAEVVRTTRSLVFLRGVMTVGDRVIATADGVWKILAWRGEPFVAG